MCRFSKAPAPDILPVDSFSCAAVLAKFCTFAHSALLSNESVKISIRIKNCKVSDELLLSTVAQVNKCVLKVARGICSDDTRSVNFVEKVFRAVDKDAVGSITVREFQDALARLGVRAHENESNILSTWFDFHSNGRISYPEFLSLLIEFMINCKQANTGAVVPALASSLRQTPGSSIMDRITSCMKRAGVSVAALGAG